MENIENRDDPNIQPELNDDGKFHLNPNLLLPFGCRETYRRDAQAYADTQRMKGREEGREEGRIEGREEGILQTERQNLLQLLEWTVAPVPEELRVRIEQMTEIDQIQRLFKMVVMRQVRSIEEFIQHLP